MDRKSENALTLLKASDFDISFKTVLIVDDDPIQHVLLEDYFRSRGVKRTLHAWDGDELNQFLLEDCVPDLVTLDLVMPECDGIQVFDVLRDLSPEVPILIISGTFETTRTAASLLAKAYRLNVLGALAKPITIVGLDAVLGGDALAAARS